MAIRLTEEQWANVLQGSDVPARVSDPDQNAVFVLVPPRLIQRVNECLKTALDLP